ncbi:MAG: polysaccharide deacetylase family protein [Paludibacter sp.]|nr:polysaccharide deacetylase family protein [Bacteroidales bacterium]MCM1069859.1 polysaccharide deacetylase family protein [Prevotella sp.]MCM1353068.1 polysaccharide deacetylase family protein [Bacteroides sp.]MCM1443425.1 polysaccharide deacetylase family protein [Muribaculum sp.]MCM1481233.1 polysaccharide deacetylase family protein [Paludibacter sp.]
MRILYQFPDWLQHLYRGVLWRVQVSSKVIYLTFDDGCIPEVTPQVLDILKHYNIKATFFCVGDNVRKYPHVFQQVLHDGHAVGNHTFHHLPGWHTSVEAYVSDVLSADSTMFHHLPTHYSLPLPLLFRPPYGRSKIRQRTLLAKTHRIVLWDVLTHDYNPRYTPERILNAIRRYSRPGSIVVFHDSLKAQHNMLTVLPAAIKWWQSQGYTFATLNDIPAQ